MTFDVVINMQVFERAVFRQAKPIMEGDLNETRAIINEEFDTPKTGREYPGSERQRRRASAPGEPPARQLGKLADSITEPDVREQGKALVGEIRITAPYAIHLERGTPRISPRPFVRPAIEELLRRRA